MKNVFKPLAKSTLIALGLTRVASVSDVAIQKKIFGLRNNTTVMISNKETDEDNQIS